MNNPSPIRIKYVALALVGLFIGCGDKTEPVASSGKPAVYVVNYPLEYFAQRIGGDLVDVRFLASPDGDPAFWKPTAEEISQIQSGDLIVRNGASYAKWVKKVSLPTSKTVVTSKEFRDKLIETKDAVVHGHGKGKHSHAGTAFTTWIDLQLAQQQATAVADAFKKLLPDEAQAIDDNLAALNKDLSELDGQMLDVAQQIGNKPLFASHPVYQYFARRYALNIEMVLWEPETVPSDGDFAALQELGKNHSAQWMIWEGEPAQESVDRLKALGIRSVVFDPCGNRPGDDQDLLKVMKQNIANLREIAGQP